MCSDFLCEAVLDSLWDMAICRVPGVHSTVFQNSAHSISHSSQGSLGVPTSPNLGNIDCCLCDYSHSGCEVITLGAFDLHFLMSDKANPLSVCLLASSELSCLFRYFVCISGMLYFVKLYSSCAIWMIMNISDFY